MPEIVFIWIVAVVSAGMGFLVGRGFKHRDEDQKIMDAMPLRQVPGAGSEPEISLSNDEIIRRAFHKVSQPGSTIAEVRGHIDRAWEAADMDRVMLDLGSKGHSLRRVLSDGKASSSVLQSMTDWDATREDEKRQDWPKFLGPDAREDIHTDDTERFDKAEVSDFLHRERASSLQNLTGCMTAADIDWQEVERRRIEAEKFSSIAQGAMVDEMRGHIRRGTRGYSAGSRRDTADSDVNVFAPATRLPPADEAKIVGELGPRSTWDEAKDRWDERQSDLTAKPER